MNSSTIDDAWQWLPLKARIALLHFLSDLPRLAGQYHSPELRFQLSQALARVTQESEITTAERGALRMASELVVCGEEVSHNICHIAFFVVTDLIGCLLFVKHALSHNGAKTSAYMTCLVLRGGCC